MSTKFFSYKLTLTAPVLIPAIAGNPNSVSTSNFIPGSVIRGVVAGKLGSEDSQFQDLVLSGTVRYLNAYPCSQDNYRTRSLPVPRSWRTEKYGNQATFDLSAHQQIEEDAQLRTPRAPYFVPSPPYRTVTPSIETNFHHQRDRKMGRATDERGAIFTYESLSANSDWSGLIAISGAEGEIGTRVKRLKELLVSPLKIGRSKQSQYGGSAHITWHDEMNRELPETWIDLLRRNDIKANQQFRLLLTSDAIVRDPASGQIDPTALPIVIQQGLGDRIRVVELFTDTVVASGFNVKWRLALPQTQAVAAGTVLVVQATADISFDDLVQLEHSGIGERRSEGFGACIFLTEPSSYEVRLTSDTTRDVSRPSDKLPESLRAIEESLLEAALTRAVERYAASLAEQASNPPSSSLLGRLRVPLRYGEAGLEELTGWFNGNDKIRLRPKAMNDINDCRLADKSLGESKSISLGEWIRQILSDDNDSLDQLCRNMFIDHPTQRYSLTGEVSEDMRRQLARKARRPMIDAVLAILARQRKSKRG